MSETQKRGIFISFEGGDGCGKTTQRNRLAEALKALGLRVVTTRELGGTAGAEALRPDMQSGSVDAWDSISELLIVSAGRHDHTEKVIKPAVAAGAWVLSDRFLDSTTLYQGYAGSAPLEVVQQVHKIAIGDFRPDLTLIFDIDPQVGLERALADAAQRQLNNIEENTRFERMGLAYHQRVREGFKSILADNPERCVLIDANRDRETIAAEVWSIVAKRFALS